MKKSNLLWALTIPILTSILFSSCTKHVVKEESKAATEISGQTTQQKVLKFLSVGYSIPSDELSFDKQSQQYIAPKYRFSMSAKDAETLYADANMYKIVYEK